MSLPIWPPFVDDESGLPLPKYGFGGTLRTPVRRTEMDSGAIRQVVRHATQQKTFQVSWNFTDSQYAEFQEFFTNDLGNGISYFTIPLPTGEGFANTNVRFVEANYDFANDQPGSWNVSATWEKEIVSVLADPASNPLPLWYRPVDTISGNATYEFDENFVLISGAPASGTTWKVTVDPGMIVGVSNAGLGGINVIPVGGDGGAGFSSFTTLSGDITLTSGDNLKCLTGAPALGSRWKVHCPSGLVLGIVNNGLGGISVIPTGGADEPVTESIHKTLKDACVVATCEIIFIPGLIASSKMDQAGTIAMVPGSKAFYIANQGSSGGFMAWADSTAAANFLTINEWWMGRDSSVGNPLTAPSTTVGMPLSGNKDIVVGIVFARDDAAAQTGCNFVRFGSDVNTTDALNCSLQLTDLNTVGNDSQAQLRWGGTTQATGGTIDPTITANLQGNGYHYLLAYYNAATTIRSLKLDNAAAVNGTALAHNGAFTAAMRIFPQYQIGSNGTTNYAQCQIAALVCADDVTKVSAIEAALKKFCDNLNAGILIAAP